MAVDGALMSAAREGRITLRFYRWEPGCLSLGRNQAAAGGWLDAEALASRGIGLVRRPTGGRAVYHHRELTYSVTLPDRAWGGPRRTYARMNRALGRGLAELGVPVDGPATDAPRVERRAERGPEASDPEVSGPEVSGPEATGPGPGSCFRAPAPGELLARGRKLVGSAQWRRRGALLQHGSILIRDEQQVAELAAGGATGGTARAEGGPAPVKRERAPEGASARTAIGLEELLPQVPAFERLVTALSAGVARELGVVVVEPARLEATETAAARRLEARYLGAEWTWRR